MVAPADGRCYLQGAIQMDERDLWKTFQQSGRVEDYLRYRGVSLSQAANTVQGERTAYGDGSKTAFDDRRPRDSGV